MKNNNYSINEILSAVDNLLGSNATKPTQGETVKEMNEILSAVNKMHSKKVAEKINETALVLKNVLKNQEVLLLKKFFTTNNPLILK
ncbi:MAG: hypothetical protein WCP48_03270 [Pseudomonadota bacterium]|jgi:hypothetical protein